MRSRMQVFFAAPSDEGGVTTLAPPVELTDAQVENLVRRSYQYVAMYNVNHKFAFKQGGWNTVDADTELKDHTMREIARPNNDTLYISCLLDLRKEPMILEMPALDSKYVSLMVTGYDHYVNIPMATRLGDFRKPEKMLLYSAGTEGYHGEPVEGVDRLFEATGDFVSAVFRVMPHANDPERYKRIVEQMQSVNLVTLSAYMGGKAKPIDDIQFPPVGKTDADVFGNNLLEVMQFVFNHTTFEPDDPLDQAVLAAYKPLGVEPGKAYDPDKVAKIDGSRFRAVAERIWTEEMAKATDQEFKKKNLLKMFQPKGRIDLDVLLFQSVLGPIGQPADEAVYPAITTMDGEPMNARHDYVIRMEKDELPPAKAFWSFTLYDKNGFFIPNNRKKYSVGENGGMKLNDDGGIEIYIAAEKPAGVPEENWLPINRKDEEIGVVLRIYVPDLEKMKTWKVPQTEKVVMKSSRPDIFPQKRSAAPSSRYMGGPAQLVTAPNRAIVNKEVLEKLPQTAWTSGPEIEKPIEGVYVLGGYLISACIVVEAEDGLIVFDTGDTKKDGEKLLEAIRTFSKKPVRAIVYGHSHYCFGAGVMAEGNTNVMVIGHPALNDVVAENMTGGGAPAFYPEVGPLLTARALQQFNAYLPDQGPDAWFSPTNISAGEMAFLSVNKPVKDGEVLDVLGIRMQFFTKYGTDDKVHTTVWLPDRQICIQNALWSTPPNLYTLRGDLYRDPREWYQCVKIVRDRAPEVLIGYGHRPIVGKEKIRETLNHYLDGISFVLDQSLRGILAGFGPEDLRHLIEMPDYLAADPHNFQSYGELSFQAPAVFYFTVGWYNGDPATIFRPSPKEEAERLVKLAGGRDRVLAEANAAFDRKEYAWAAQLVNYLLKLNPEDKDIRLFKAKVLRQLAYLSTGANARSLLLTTALALEGKVAVPRIIPPNPAVIAQNPTTFVDYFRVRIDPIKSGDTDEVIEFKFAGRDKTAGLHVRRAVAEFLADPKEYYRPADIVIALSGETWAKLYLNSSSVEDLIENGELEIERGTAAEAVGLFDMFDKYRPEKAVLVGPHLHG